MEHLERSPTEATPAKPHHPGLGKARYAGASASPAPRSSMSGVLSLNRTSTPATDRQADGGNHLLGLLRAESIEEYGRLLAILEPVNLPRGLVLFEPGEPITSVYFSKGCCASLIKVLEEGKRIEVGTIGLEGMVGLSAFFGVERVPILCHIQIPGPALRLKAAKLRELATPGTALHGLLQRYAQYLFDQAAQSLACNWLHTIDQRCARWLLMSHDRVHGDLLELTHEYLATMLGARRAGVSEAAAALQQAGLIHYRRGKITITDRAGLEAASCECYRSDRMDYERLFPYGE